MIKTTTANYFLQAFPLPSCQRCHGEDGDVARRGLVWPGEAVATLNTVTLFTTPKVT